MIFDTINQAIQAKKLDENNMEDSIKNKNIDDSFSLELKENNGNIFSLNFHEEFYNNIINKEEWNENEKIFNLENDSNIKIVIKIVNKIMQKINDYFRENYHQKFLRSKNFFNKFTKNENKNNFKPKFCNFRNLSYVKSKNIIFEPKFIGFFRKRGITNLNLKNVDSILDFKQRALSTIKTIHEENG